MADAEKKTENLGLTVFDDINGVYQRDLRKSYDDNFRKIDTGIKALETSLTQYLDEQLGVIENGAY